MHNLSLTEAMGKKKALVEPKKKAPTAATGGAGFDFEDMVAGQFLLSILGIPHPLGQEFGRPVKIEWQARESGWLADDLILVSELNGKIRTAGASLKSGQRVTLNGFPAEFIGMAWNQWRGAGTKRQFARTDDVLVLITGNGKDTAKGPWDDLIKQSLVADASRIVERLKDNGKSGNQSSESQRKIFRSFRPNSLDGVPDFEVVELMRQTRWLDFDFLANTSRSLQQAILDCQSILEPKDADKAHDLWLALLEIGKRYRPSGGTMTVKNLYDELRSFSFRENPNYEADWSELDRRSSLELGAIKTTVAGLPSIPREKQLDELANGLEESPICVMIGESGSGKSALAKIQSQKFLHTIWLNSDQCDRQSLADLERDYGLRHSIANIVEGTPGSTLIVFDAVEGFGESAKKLAIQLVRELSVAKCSRTKILVTSQASGSQTFLTALSQLGIGSNVIKVLTIDRPDQPSISDLVKDLPHVGWIALSPELQSLLTNLKILDWFVQFAQSGGKLDTAKIGLTPLIDSLWTHWIGTQSDQFSRADVLRAVAGIEADRHIASVPVDNLSHVQQQTLGTLTSDDLLRVRDNRIRFSHDLISDWARLNTLLDGDWITSGENRSKYAKPRWFRAIRLYGQRLLEMQDDGGAAWRNGIDLLEDGTDTGTLIRDLILEALFLAPNADTLLVQAWPKLIAKDGALLRIMLKRFQFVATYPDTMLTRLIAEGDDPSNYEHFMRIPYWPYWGPVLEVLHSHLADVIRLAPHTAASVAGMWLRSMNFEPKPGHKIKWREEAADIALAAGRRIQRFNEEGNYYSQGADEEVFKAVFQASPELPVAVGQYCLEMAKRRDLDPAIQEEVAEAIAQKQRELIARRNNSPKRRSRPIPSILSWEGELNPQWPDGPSERVDDEFEAAVLSGSDFSALIKTNPDAALEILLAVCIEAPKRESYGSSDMDRIGLNWWTKASPPSWFRGPFYHFFKLNPQTAITFTIKLANFASERYTKNGLYFRVDGKKKLWRGDGATFTWHYDGYLSHGESLVCALMAMEKWFYDQLDANVDITEFVERVMRESKSLAIAGLMLAVGKRAPELFLGPLKPLTNSWIVWEWDLQLSAQRANGFRGPMGMIRNEGKLVFELLREWASMPHRKAAMRDLICKHFLHDDKYEPFFKRLRASWKRELNKDRSLTDLNHLLMVLDRTNYRYETINGKNVPVGFTWPAQAAQVLNDRAESANSNFRYIKFPQECRRLLTLRKNIEAAAAAEVFGITKDYHGGAASSDGEKGDTLYTKDDVVMAGVAVLICLADEWLSQRPEALRWCRERLEEEGRSAEFNPSFYNDFNGGNDRRDAFAADCAIAIMTRDRNNELGRVLLARSVLVHSYSTTALVVRLAALSRKSLGDEFYRIIRLALEWSALRAQIHSAVPPRTEEELSVLFPKMELLRQEFISAKLPPSLPDLSKLNAEGLAAIVAMRLRARPESAQFARDLSRSRARVEMSPDIMGLDERLVRASLSWLDIADSQTSLHPSETYGLIRSMLEMVLSRLPDTEGIDGARIEGHPSEFDSWVFEVVSHSLVAMGGEDDPESLWKPILELGPPAHQWVERFFWQWFTDGFEKTTNYEAFFARWREMIEFALNSPKWDPRSQWNSRLDEMVRELMGFNSGWSWIAKDGIDKYLAGMNDLYSRAAARWFHMPDVFSSFVFFLQREAVASFRIQAIGWIAAAIKDFSDHSWRHGAETGLIDFLNLCWRKNAKAITSDPSLLNEFFRIVNVMVARQSHPAIALRDRIAQETQP